MQDSATEKFFPTGRQNELRHVMIQLEEASRGQTEIEEPSHSSTFTRFAIRQPPRTIALTAQGGKRTNGSIEKGKRVQTKGHFRSTAQRKKQTQKGPTVVMDMSIMSNYNNDTAEQSGKESLQANTLRNSIEKPKSNITIKKNSQFYHLKGSKCKLNDGEEKYKQLKEFASRQ